MLVSKSPTSLLRHWRPNLGVLVTPDVGTAPAAIERWGDTGGVWAMDNAAFTGFNEDRYRRMLDRFAGIRGCMWVTAPDVVEDAEATIDLFHEWVNTLADYGYPTALVAQDGLKAGSVPWLEVDCLFIGGSTEWKLGRDAAEVVKNAKAQGKLVHMGRVNSRRRIKYAKGIGCDSIDGTGASMFTDASLPRYLEWAAAPTQTMFGGQP